MADCVLLDRNNIKQFIDSIDTVLTDCDGVLWHGASVIPGTPAVIEKFKQMGKRVFYVTNNSTKTREHYMTKCSTMGFPAMKEDIVGSGYTTAQYMKNELHLTGKVYVVGSMALSQELYDVGLENFGAGPDPLGDLSFDDVAKLPLDPEVTAVVVGLDPDFNYLKMSKAIAYLQRGCRFIATNADANLPMGTILLPGAGSMVAAVARAGERSPDIVCGKPNSMMLQVLQRHHKIDPDRTVMIGDRLNTDIEFAHSCGLKSLFVQTGISTLDEVREKQKSALAEDKRHIPHFYLPSLETLAPLLENMNNASTKCSLE